MVISIVKSVDLPIATDQAHQPTGYNAVIIDGRHMVRIQVRGSMPVAVHIPYFFRPGVYKGITGVYLLIQRRDGILVTA